jgi:hypothetical protein
VDISHTASSTDPDYGPAVAYTGGTAPGNVVRAAITDIDVAGLVLSSSNITLIEDQGDAAYTMSLRSKPTSDILYELSFSTTFEATTSGSYTVAFTPDNWNVPQTVTLTLGDADIYSTHSASLIHTIAVSSDVNYPVGNQAVITVTARDADEPGVAITLPNGVINLTEYGIDDKYYIKLKSRPTANVTSQSTGTNRLPHPLRPSFSPRKTGIPTRSQPFPPSTIILSKATIPPRSFTEPHQQTRITTACPPP